jgi:peptidoglycan/xylan/chitin deacetylase (PgdA/CDA1 family)
VSQPLRIAFLVGSDSRSTRYSIEAVCGLQGIEPVGVLHDTAVVPFKRRRKNLLRNITSNGWSYPLVRMADMISEATGKAVSNAAVPRGDVRKVLKEAFPDACFSLAELGTKYRMPIHSAGGLNSDQARRILRETGADLGIVLGTRVLRAGTFRVPRLGCINLHKGTVPEYRGMPAGFWELYDGAASAGVTVHFVDEGLDTGDILAARSIPIAKTETPDTLKEKLHVEGALALATAVAAIRDGKAEPRKQGKFEGKPRTKPTRTEESDLQKRLPHWQRRRAVSSIARNLYLLFVYYCGLYLLARQWHRMSKSRCAIFLHHRVNDYAKDPLTVDTETFAAQLLAISKRYPFTSTADIVERIAANKPLTPTTITIHFDDCYRDILTHGAPILKALHIPACAFINSGFIGTTRTFEHDAARYPFQFEMLTASEVQEWSSLGFEVGAHTVNHVNLGRIRVEDARVEIVRCGEELETILGKPVSFFSFPYGRPENITPETRQIVQAAGYTALFSAHGGCIGSGTSVYDIPRGGANHEASPIYCLLQIEGLTPSQLAAKLRR